MHETNQLQGWLRGWDTPVKQECADGRLTALLSCCRPAPVQSRHCTCMCSGTQLDRHAVLLGPSSLEAMPCVQIVGRAEPHNLAILHNEQNRVMTIRENARCQGFPDYYALVGRTRASRHGCLVRNSSLTDRHAPGSQSVRQIGIGFRVWGLGFRACLRAGCEGGWAGCSPCLLRQP